MNMRTPTKVKLTSKYADVLVHLAALLFLFNSALAFGDCCVVVPSIGDKVATTVAVNEVSTVPPCHKKAAAPLEQNQTVQNESLTDDNCCMACVTAYVTSIEQVATGTASHAAYIPELYSTSLGTLEPLYRPPIHTFL